MIDAASIAGSGEINVSGGDYVRAGWPDYGGSGGGGRVALFIDDLGTFSPESQVRAYGGVTVASWDWSYYFQAAAGTVLVSDADATYGRLIVDAGGLSPSAPTKATELPVLGSGAVVQIEATGNDAWVTASTPFQERWLGAWMRLTDASGDLIESYLVVQLDAQGRALLAAAGGAATTALDYVGEYRFDELAEVGGAVLQTPDLLRLGVGPVLSIADASVDEELGAVEFLLTVDGAGPDGISVDFATADGTAVAGLDYLATSGTLQIAAGATTANVSVGILSDAITESDETLSLELSNLAGATFDTSTATATIVDDDPAPAALDPALVAYWPFDDHADPSLELTGQAVAAQLGSLFGTDTNDPSFLCQSGTIPPLTDNHCGLDLTGDLDEATGDYVRVPNHPALDFTDAFTLSAWIRIDSTAVTTYRPIFVRGADDGVSDANDIDIFTYAPTGELDVRFNRGNGGVFDEVLFTSPPLDTLFHLAIAYDGNEVRAYYDGVNQTVTWGDSTLQAPLATGKPWLIGKINHGDFIAPEWGGGRVKFFDGLIDEVRFYDRTLSSTEVFALATAADASPVASFTFECAGLKCAFDASASTDDLGITSFEWDFGDGAVASDSQGLSDHRFALIRGGQFDVQLTVTDAAGQRDQVIHNVKVFSVEEFVTLIRNR